MLNEEVRELMRWSDRHRKVLARLTLVLVLTLIVDAIGTVLIYACERGADRGDIHNLFDAFFFTTVQLLTVSSQIKNPLTTPGRVVDILLEIWAVIVVAGSAGAITSFFTEGDAARRRQAEARSRSAAGG
jgi:hypothetical protein